MSDLTLDHVGEVPVALELPPEEPGPFAPCALLLDCSSSMSSCIAELNRGVELFAERLKADELARNRADVTVIEFRDSARVIVPPTLGRDFLAPRLHANGLTAMGEAIELGLRTVKERRRDYRRNGARAFKPMMFLFTDGAPTDAWQAAAAEVRRQATEKGLNFFGIGFGADADFGVLRDICPENRPPMRLKPGCFENLFEWISDSMSSVSGSAPGESISLPPADGWGEAAV